LDVVKNLRKALQHFTGMKMAAAAAIQDEPNEKHPTLGLVKTHVVRKTSPASDCFKDAEC